MITRTLLGILAAMLGASSLANDDKLLLGVLEEVPGVYAGEASSRRVRVLFARTNLGWAAYKSDCAGPECLTAVTREYPREVTWFVGLDGNELGQIVARTPSDFRFYAHVGLQDIVRGTAPVIGKPSYEYAGFSGGEVHRPLVTVSRPHFKDPAQWKRIKITPDVRERALAMLRGRFPRLCRYKPKGDELVPFRYRANDLRVRAYRSSSRSLVVSIDLRDTYYCENTVGDGLLDTHTFALKPSGEVLFLGPGLVLVDAGDYDQDGRSELLFALSLYNRGGYVLFVDNFIEQARFEFGYH